MVRLPGRSVKHDTNQPHCGGDRACLEGFDHCFEVGTPMNRVGNGLIFEVKSCIRMAHYPENVLAPTVGRLAGASRVPLLVREKGPNHHSSIPQIGGMHCMV